MNDVVLLYILAASALVIFIGMLAVVWKSLTIAHDLAKIVLQAGITPPQGLPKPSPPPVVPKPAPQPSVVVDQGLVNAVKKFEGFAAKAAWDYKQYTNGYGTKALSATEVIDEAEAEKRLAVEIGKAAHSVETFAPDAPLGVKQALTDLTYNAGFGWSERSLGAAVKAKKWDTVKADILLYNHDGGQVLDGLTKRREAEVAWIDNPL
jgi:GH24 family phage-related lysozyme (muramidase)